jgi:predicted N-acetyltransferase YhbS
MLRSARGFAKVSERVREGARTDYARSRVASSGRLIGCCRMWPSHVGAGRAYFLGPLAIDPRLQRTGLGAQLVQATIEGARGSGFDGIVLVGRPQFFSRFGFQQIPEGRVTLPGPVDPQRLQWLELQPGGLARLAGPLIAFRAASRA